MTSDITLTVILIGFPVCSIVLYYAILRLFDTVSPVRDLKKRPVPKRKKHIRLSSAGDKEKKTHTFISGI